MSFSVRRSIAHIRITPSRASLVRHVGLALRIAVSCLVVDSMVGQSTLSVPSQYPTIAAAFAAAVDGDTVLVDDGTYVESNLDFAGRRLVLRSVGGPAVTVLDAAGAPNLLLVQNDEPPGTRVEGFTLRGVTGTSGVDSALWISGLGAPGPSLEVVDCVFEANVTVSGAAVYAGRTCDVLLRGCVFVDNTTTGSNGGAVRVAGDILTQDAPSVRIEGCRFFDNHLAPTFLTFGGAALFVSGPSHVVVSDSLFVGNDATSMPLESSTIQLESPLPMFAPPAVVEVVGCTVAGNARNPIHVGASSRLVMRDTIVWGNASGTGLSADLGLSGFPTDLDIAYCDIEGGIPSPATDRTVVTFQNVVVDPQFVDPTIDDFHLLPTSPLIDAGDPTRTVAGTDADGDTRAIDGDGDNTRRIDIGADEVSRFTISASTPAPAAGAGFSVLASATRPGDTLVAAVLFASLGEADVFFPSFGQLLLDPTGLVELPMPSGTALLTNPGGMPGLPVSLQAVGVVSDATRTFFQLSGRVRVTLR
jgi:hypothetical protein